MTSYLAFKVELIPEVGTKLGHLFTPSLNQIISASTAVWDRGATPSLQPYPSRTP